MSRPTITAEEFQKLIGLYTMARRGAHQGERDNARTIFLRRIEKAGITEERFHAYLEARHPDKVLHERVNGAQEKGPNPFGSGRRTTTSDLDDMMRNWAEQVREMDRRAREAQERREREEAETARRNRAASDARRHAEARRRDLATGLFHELHRIRRESGFRRFAEVRFEIEEMDILMEALQRMMGAEPGPQPQPPPKQDYRYWSDPGYGRKW